MSLSTPIPPQRLHDWLTEQVRAIEQRDRQAAQAGSDASERCIETALGPLFGGVIHEWLGVDRAGSTWLPPLCILSDCAQRAIEHHAGFVFWVGRPCWPHPRTLIRGAAASREPRGTTPRGTRNEQRGTRNSSAVQSVTKRELRYAEQRPQSLQRPARALQPRSSFLVPRCSACLLQRSVLVDVSRSERLWALDLICRSEAAAAIIADGTGLDMAATRRLQLAAEAGRALLLVARPTRDLGTGSVAACRWQVRPIASPTHAPRWSVQLLRCKDDRIKVNHQAKLLEWNNATGLVYLPAEVVDRSAAKTRRSA